MVFGRDEDQFRNWLAEHQGIIHKVAGSFTDSAQDREDLVQEILLKIWSAMPSFRGESKASTWIYRVALNRAMSWRRDAKKHLERSVPIVEISSADSGCSLQEAELLEQLYCAIRALGEVDRSLILMALDDCSYQEMADVMGMTVNNVGVRLNRAKRELSQTMGPTD